MYCPWVLPPFQCTFVCEWICRYHDEEWGVPVYDDNQLFELLVLEGAQVGGGGVTGSSLKGLERRVGGGGNS